MDRNLQAAAAFYGQEYIKVDRGMQKNKQIEARNKVALMSIQLLTTWTSFNLTSDGGGGGYVQRIFICDIKEEVKK